MGREYKKPCSNCYETGKICDVCYGAEVVTCCEDDDCDKCNGTGDPECIFCKLCPQCDGMGYYEVFIEYCSVCGGIDEVECDCTGRIGVEYADNDCIACVGGTHECLHCHGLGLDPDDLVEHGVNECLIRANS